MKKLILVICLVVLPFVFCSCAAPIYALRALREAQLEISEQGTVYGSEYDTGYDKYDSYDSPYDNYDEYYDDGMDYNTGYDDGYNDGYYDGYYDALEESGYDEFSTAPALPQSGASFAPSFS